MGCHTYFHYLVPQTPSNFKNRKNKVIFGSNHPSAWVMISKGLKNGQIYDDWRVIITKQLPVGIEKGKIPFIRCKDHYGKTILTLKQLKSYFKRHKIEASEYIHLFEYAWKKYPNGFVQLD